MLTEKLYKQKMKIGNNNKFQSGVYQFIINVHQSSDTGSFIADKNPKIANLYNKVFDLLDKNNLIIDNQKRIEGISEKIAKALDDNYVERCIEIDNN